jgi:hypothetical protein
MLWVRTPFRRGVFYTTLCVNVCQWLAAGRWFYPVPSTNKTDRHDINRTLLKMALNTLTLTLTLYIVFYNTIQTVIIIRIERFHWVATYFFNRVYMIFFLDVHDKIYNSLIWVWSTRRPDLSENKNLTKYNCSTIVVCSCLKPRIDEPRY